MHESADEQRIIDGEHLRLLRLGYFVSGATTACFALFGVFYGLMGFAFRTLATHMPKHAGDPGPPRQFFWIFVIFGFGFALVAGIVAALKLRVARCVRRRESHGFCVAVAAISCLEVPYGTVLGVLSFLVLTRPSVKALFLRPAQESLPPS